MKNIRRLETNCDRVEIMETRKISKQVNWRLVKILEKAK